MKKLTYLLVAISLALLSIRIYDSDLSILDDPQVNICDRSTVNSYQCNQSQPLPSIECYHNQANKYLKIHVIPHNHAELGWRFNLNQYYYGIYPEAGPVASSIDAYVFSMLNDPAKHFI